MGRVLERMKSDGGATSIEYALMAGLIAVVVAGSVFTLGLGVLRLFQQFQLP